MSYSTLTTKFFVFALLLGLFSCALKKDREFTAAELVVKPFVNKAGRTIEGAEEYYLKTKGQEYFIKLSECEPKIVSELKLWGEGTVVVRFDIKNGLWDTDNPEVQSRIGDYVVILGMYK